MTVPIYLGDSLQLRFESRDMFAERNVTVRVNDEDDTELVFPISLVNRAENFDQLMVDVADYIENGQDPKMALQEIVGLSDDELKTLSATIGRLQDLARQRA